MVQTELYGDYLECYVRIAAAKNLLRIRLTQAGLATSGIDVSERRAGLICNNSSLTT